MHANMESNVWSTSTTVCILKETRQYFIIELSDLSYTIVTILDYGKSTYIMFNCITRSN